MRSQDLQQQLRSKEQDLEQLFQKQRRVSWFRGIICFRAACIFVLTAKCIFSMTSVGTTMSRASQRAPGEPPGERQTENDQWGAVSWAGTHLPGADVGTGAAGSFAGAGISTTAGERDVSLCGFFGGGSFVWLRIKHIIFLFYREMYRITEGLQREKQSLMKQLDLLRWAL